MVENDHFLKSIFPEHNKRHPNQLSRFVLPFVSIQICDSFHVKFRVSCILIRIQICDAFHIMFRVPFGIFIRIWFRIWFRFQIFD